jgi:hypothetical protein
MIFEDFLRAEIVASITSAHTELDVVQGVSPANNSAALETHGIDTQIENTDGDTKPSEQTWWKVGIYQGIEIVQ